MPRARSQLIDLQTTPYYHLVSRCVRRAFLCGKDHSTGKSYEHRKDWIEQRLRLLSSIFAIDVCAYAIMSNHYHLVIHVNLQDNEAWSDDEIIRRWRMLFKGSPLLQRYANDEMLNLEETEALKHQTQALRLRLVSVSWFMKCLNESLARQANREDKCTGHFWESRFKSQALKSEKDLLACMAYVDLNPVRAAIASTPESSPFTSIRERIKSNFDLSKAVKDQMAIGMPRSFDGTLRPLAPFNNEEAKHPNEFRLPFTSLTYYELVDWTGRQSVGNKKGKIPNGLSPLLNRLGLTSTAWLYQAHHFEQWHATSAQTHVRSKSRQVSPADDFVRLSSSA